MHEMEKDFAAGQLQGRSEGRLREGILADSDPQYQENLKLFNEVVDAFKDQTADNIIEHLRDVRKKMETMRIQFQALSAILENRLNNDSQIKYRHQY